MQGVFIVIPARNEAQKIGEVLLEIQKEGFKNIVVVDDGSTDKTAEVASKNGAMVLRHVINRGQGAALKTGNVFSLQQNAEIIVHFDADGQMQVGDIALMLKPILAKEVDVTLGSRFLGQVENIDLGKKIVLKFARILVFLLYKIWLTDPQNGFRALTRQACEKINIKSNRMEHAGEILGEIKKKALRYKEIPVTIKYTDYSRIKGQHWTASFSLGLKMIFQKLLK